MRLNNAAVSTQLPLPTFPAMHNPNGGAPAVAVPSSARMIAPLEVELRPEWNGPTTRFNHTWEGIVNIDQFRWMVRRDVQEHLELAQRELGARQVRAVGMFDDEMRVFRPSPA